MQPLSDIRNGSATVYCHLLMCGLRVKLSGRAEATDWSRGCTLSSRARGETTDFHGTLQRLLDGSGTDSSFGYLGSADSFPSFSPVSTACMSIARLLAIRVEDRVDPHVKTGWYT